MLIPLKETIANNSRNCAENATVDMNAAGPLSVENRVKHIESLSMKCSVLIVCTTSDTSTARPAMQ